MKLIRRIINKYKHHIQGYKHVYFDGKGTCFLYTKEAKNKQDSAQIREQVRKHF